MWLFVIVYYLYEYFLLKYLFVYSFWSFFDHVAHDDDNDPVSTLLAINLTGNKSRIAIIGSTFGFLW